MEMESVDRNEIDRASMLFQQECWDASLSEADVNEFPSIDSSIHYAAPPSPPPLRLIRKMLPKMQASCCAKSMMKRKDRV